MTVRDKAERGVFEHGGSGHRPTALLVAETSEPHLLSDDPFIDDGLEFTRAIGLVHAQAAFAHLQPDLVFLPIVVDGQSSRRFLDHILSAPAQPVVVVIASNDQINAAAEAMRLGAFDCLFRPFSTQRLARTLAAATAALPARGLLGAASMADTPRGAGPATPADAAALAPPGDETPVFASPQMQAVMARIDAVARSDSPVFLSGEDGTGKSLLAGLLHARSQRADGPLVTVDCTSLTAAQFGAEIAGPDGAFARAARGTLHLDEIGELDPALQPRLLAQVDQALSPAHGTGARPRLITSTRHDGTALLRRGQLRPELYYRLHVSPIALPPLRAREGDVSRIAEARLAAFARSEGRGFTGLRRDTLERLERHDWPGNVRELVNAIWSIVVLHDGVEVTPEMLPASITAPSPIAAGRDPVGLDSLIGMTLDEIEQRVIEATIRAEGGSVPRAARVLGVSPSTIYRKREAWTRRTLR